MKKLRDLKIGEVMDLCRMSHCNRGCPLACGDRACLLDSVPANWEDSCELGRPAGKWGNVKILEPAEIHAPAEVQESAEKQVPAEVQVPAEEQEPAEDRKTAGKRGTVKVQEPAEIHAPAEVQEDAEKRVTAGLPAEMQEPTELKVLKPDAEGFTEVSLDNFLKLRKKDGIYASLIAPPELRQRMRAATSWDEFERSLAEFLKITKTATDQGTSPGKAEQKTGKKQKTKRKTADQQAPAEKSDDPGLNPSDFTKGGADSAAQGTSPGKPEQKPEKKQKAGRKTADQQGPAEKPDDPGLSKPGKKTKRKATDQQESL